MADNMKVILKDGEIAQRQTLITVAEWDGTKYGGTETDREVLGVRTEESAIEFNADIETSTDIRGNTYSDVNKTEPTQSFDPFYVMGGSKLASYLTQAALKNDIAAYNNVFKVYIIAAYLRKDGTIDSEGKCYTVMHENCSIIPTSLGGDTKTSMPIEVHYSNNITEGTVTVGANGKLSADTFEFTEGLEAISAFSKVNIPKKD